MSSILVVDDDISILKSVERILSKQYKPIVLNEIDEFDRCIQENEFQVVFMDYDLKRQENGIDLAKRIKKINIFTRIVLFTGETRLDVVTNALNSGVIDAFLSKPITPTDLLNILEANIEAYRHNIENIDKIFSLLRSNKKIQIDKLIELGLNIETLEYILNSQIDASNIDAIQYAIYIMSDQALKYENTRQLGDIINDIDIFMNFIKTVSLAANDIFIDHSIRRMNKVVLDTITLLILNMKQLTYIIMIATQEEDENVPIKAFEDMMITIDSIVQSSGYRQDEFTEEITNQIDLLLSSFVI